MPLNLYKDINYQYILEHVKPVELISFYANLLLHWFIFSRMKKSLGVVLVSYGLGYLTNIYFEKNKNLRNRKFLLYIDHKLNYRYCVWYSWLLFHIIWVAVHEVCVIITQFL